MNIGLLLQPMKHYVSATGIFPYQKQGYIAAISPTPCAVVNQLLSLRVFAAVAEAGSFSRAADRLNISTTAASRHVADLEKHLRSSLLIRNTRRLALTPLGEEYLERSQRILSLVDEADAVASDAMQTPAGSLRVNLPVCFGIRYVAPLVAEFAVRFPEIDLEISFADHFVDLVEEGIDVAVRIAPALTPSLIARPLAAIRVIPCAAPAYLAARGKPRTPDELRNHDCLSYNHAPGGDSWTFLHPDGEESVRIKPVFKSNHGEMILQMSLAGRGIALQPDFIIHDELRAGRLLRILPEYTLPERQLYAVYLAASRRSGKVKAFIDYLAGKLAELARVWRLES